MAYKETYSQVKTFAIPDVQRNIIRQRLDAFPWWFAALLLIVAVVVYMIVSTPSYNEAFTFIRAGLGMTISTTFTAYLFALVLGLLAGLGRISKSVFFRNFSTLYVEMVRGIPMLVLIFFIALVGVPAAVTALNGLGAWLIELGVPSVGQVLAGLNNKGIAMSARAVVALSITYGAFLAEIFRAGIQSIGRGQMEAARSQGMTYWQAMWYIILPQAIRNVLPALGNDFVSMLKDSSLVSVLAVRDVTQVARLYAGQSFRFPEAYTTLALMYLSMTVVLSLLVKFLERRYQQNERA